MPTLINKSLITATAYRTKWWDPAFTLDDNPSTSWRGETSGDPAYIQWDLGQAYLLEQYDFQNHDSPYGLNFSVSVWVANESDFSDEVRCTNLNSTYGVDKLDQPFLDYTTTDPITDPYQYIRIVGNNWAMEEIYIYGVPPTSGLDLTGAAHLQRRATSKGVSTYLDRFQARYDYLYQALAVLATETSPDVWEVTPYPGVAVISAGSDYQYSQDFTFYGGETYTVVASLATALSNAGYEVT